MEIYRRCTLAQVLGCLLCEQVSYTTKKKKEKTVVVCCSLVHTLSCSYPSIPDLSWSHAQQYFGKEQPFWVPRVAILLVRNEKQPFPDFASRVYIYMYIYSGKLNVSVAEEANCVLAMKLRWFRRPIQTTDVCYGNYWGCRFRLILFRSLLGLTKLLNRGGSRYKCVDPTCVAQYFSLGPTLGRGSFIWLSLHAFSSVSFEELTNSVGKNRRYPYKAGTRLPCQAGC